MNSVQATPRPRPPAKVRRASSNQASPPPPYLSTFTFPSIQSGESKASANRTTSTVDVVPEDWLKEVSREELAEMLQMADGVIKERANELGLASAVAKTLHRNSASLKGKHEALLARIPLSRHTSGVSTPISPDPSSPSPPLSGTQTPHFYSADLSRDPVIPSLLFSSSDSSAPATPILRSSYHRARKISVSPTDIAFLSDQNAELIQKLERLETDSAHADQIGRRKLTRLEKDIQILREELEKTRERSDALEEKAKNSFGLVIADNMKKEREERMRILRGPINHGEDEVEKEIRDFAPASELGISTSAKRQNKDVGPSLAQSSSPFSTLSQMQQIPSQEYTVIAQLLAKIQELEETNMQITLHQAETTERLAAVQRDASNISKLYDLLGEQTGLDLELVADNSDSTEEATPTKSTDATGTIRFRSLRRSLEGDVAKMLAGGTIKVHPAKPRPSIVGYFDYAPASRTQKCDVSEVQEGEGEPTAEPTLFSQTEVGRSRCHSLADSQSLLSPALSSLNILTPHSHALRQLAQMVNEDGKTLGSELGVGEDVWGAQERHPSHHLRTTSLYDLSSAGDASRGSPLLGVDAPKQGEDAAEVDAATRAQRLTQTIKMRTGRWVQGRFRSALGEYEEKEGGGGGQGAPAHAAPAKSKTQTSESEAAPVPMPSRLANVFAGMSAGHDEPLPGARDVKEKAGDEDKSGQLRGVRKLVFEVWLWLQFAMIVFVFVFAMARKGPRDVLGTADRRRGAAKKP